ncbi:PREDICTED: uncharacterized protein LOC109469329 [Branchiostoma belcheri]|uniref:Uncharacterized protein LOC109469329 n=1 Tax=Branchiostoma belcheri TaxID=7741 RepID=A0A6P4YX92_BRABE|nr:PREDICTED: uncharacterized protein LOC109469329 [Branchiostoma belcheri]
MAVTGSAGGLEDPLHLNCYCTVVKDQSPLQVKSLIELTAEELQTTSSNKTRIPLRFVAVIDESGSMASEIGNETLIYKVKIFAQVLVRKMQAEDMLGIVGFDSETRVLLPITKMDNDGKKAAMQSIQSLSAKTLTNLSEGILTGVKLFGVADEGTQYRNGMVVFTDGMANEGITDADGIVSAFNSTIQQTLGSNFCLPISTLTIGDYKPDLLLEISQRLGSDAFYWINDMDTFETDMMIPFFLRETSLVSDVHVTLQPLSGVTFDLTKMASDRMVLSTQQSDSSPVEYYIHDISADMAKHLPCYITMHAREKKMKDKPIMEVHVTYRDYNNAPRELRLIITFTNVTLAELRKKSKQQTTPSDNKVIAYMDSNVPMAITEITRAETAIAKIAQEEWRTMAVLTIKNAADYFGKDEVIMAQDAIQETTNDIEQRKTEVNTVLSGQPAVVTCERADAMIEALDHCLTIIDAGRPDGWNTMKTMASSLANECPTTGKIFPGEARPFAPPAMEAELENYRKIVDQQKQQQKQKPPPKPKTFKDRHVAVSEKLSKSSQEKIKELIIEHGGNPVPFVKNKAAYNILVCSRAEFNDKSVKVRDALENQSPPQMKVLLELSADEKRLEASGHQRTPLRFVAVIDESYSMDERIGLDKLTLIQRMQIFAELMVKDFKDEDNMGIVTFADDAKVVLPMTKMDSRGRESALEKIKNIETRGQTNLSDGILTAISMFKGSSGSHFHNGIILFTDGQANQGITDAEELVREYNSKMAGLGEGVCLPITSFTIGDYRPKLLCEVAQTMGSDAFFWLSDDTDFEVDMMIPIFLRETCLVSNIRIALRTLNGVTFDTLKMFSPFMVSCVESNDKTVKYFLHDISADMLKHIPCSLLLPKDYKKSLKNKDVMEVHIEYLDLENVEREILTKIPFKSTSMAEILKNDNHENTGRNGALSAKENNGRRHNSGARTPAHIRMDRRTRRLRVPTEAEMYVVAYSDSNHQSDVNVVQRAQQAVVKIAQEDCRMVTVGTINRAAEFVDYRDYSYSLRLVNGGIDEIKRIKSEVRTITDEDSRTVVGNFAATMIDSLGYCVTLLEDPQESHWARMKAMESSLANESPTAGGVFGGHNRPYLPPRVERSIQKYRAIVNLRKGPKSPKTVKKMCVEAKRNTKAVLTTRIFKNRKFTLSDKLIADGNKMGSQETIKELIIKHGGTPVPFMFESVLLCTKKEYEKNTAKVRDAKANKIPILFEEFIYDSIRAKKMMDIDGYRYA